MTFAGTSLGSVFEAITAVLSNRHITQRVQGTRSRFAIGTAAMLFAIVALNGCGGGGYAGGGIASLSATSFVIDAGQSVNITANLTGSYQVGWAFNGASCSGSVCGALSSASGTTTTYTAPSGIISSMQVVLVA